MIDVKIEKVFLWLLNIFYVYVKNIQHGLHFWVMRCIIVLNKKDETVKNIQYNIRQ